jgi:DNA-binding IclR family transcriptional regulator
LIDLTRNTITEPRELYRRLTREISFDREEYAIGVSCAAVPVTDATGAMVGALAVSCSAEKLPIIEAAAHRMRATAAQITRTLSFSM